MLRYKLVAKADLRPEVSELFIRVPESLTEERFVRAIGEGDARVLSAVKIFTQDNDPGWRYIMRRSDGRRKKATSLAAYWRCRGLYRDMPTTPGYRNASRPRIAFYRAAAAFENGAHMLELIQL